MATLEGATLPAPAMSASEVYAELSTWVDRFSTLGIVALVRYSHEEESAFLKLNIQLRKPRYPQEFLTDIAAIGISLVGGSNILMDGVPATMGIVGSAPPNDLPAIPSPSFSIMQSLGYNWVYLTGASRQRSASAVATAISILKTNSWRMTPNEYRTLYPDDLEMSAPKYQITS